MLPNTKQDVLTIWARCRPACCRSAIDWERVTLAKAGVRNGEYDRPAVIAKTVDRLLEELTMRYEVREHKPDAVNPKPGWAVWDTVEHRQVGYYADRSRAEERAKARNAMHTNDTIAAGVKPNLADVIAADTAAAEREAEEPERFEGIA